jgi:hypothetical protein
MPVNGHVGANVRVEPKGDFLVYISKVDAFDAQHLLPKLGRVRLRFAPALAVGDFPSTLPRQPPAVGQKRQAGRCGRRCQPTCLNRRDGRTPPAAVIEYR